MSKTNSVTITLDDEALAVFQNASQIVTKAGIRVPTGQLVQTMINAEMSRLSAHKIAQRFLKTVMQQLGALAERDLDEDENDGPISSIAPPPPSPAS